MHLDDLVESMSYLVVTSRRRRKPDGPRRPVLGPWLAAAMVGAYVLWFVLVTR